VASFVEFVRPRDTRRGRHGGVEWSLRRRLETGRRSGGRQAARPSTFRQV